MLTDNELDGVISTIMNEDGSWPDMPVIDADSCLLTKSSGEVSPTATLVNEPYHYTLLPEDVTGKMPLSLKWLSISPTPESQTPIPNHSPLSTNLPSASTYDCDSPLNMPMPSPVPVHQQKWIHRRLWARENNDGEHRRNLFPSNVIPRPRSKFDESVPSSLPRCPEKQSAPVVLIQPPRQSGVLARSSSISTSVTSTMSSHTVTKHQLMPKKSILSTRSSDTRHSKHGRSRSGSTPSVKFADAPTYYYDNEYKYAYDEEYEDDDEEYDSPTTSTTPCIPHFSPHKAGVRINPSKVRQALDRLIPFSRRSSERPSISGPYPLWKEKDVDGGSIRSIAFSVKSAPTSKLRVRSFWGRMMACTTQ